MNALFGICNKIHVDAFVQPGRKINETAAPAKIKVDFRPLYLCACYLSKLKKKTFIAFKSMGLICAEIKHCQKTATMYKLSLSKYTPNCILYSNKCIEGIDAH